MQNYVEPEKCAICSQAPDDILMLACAHDLCLTCASQNFNIQHKNSRNNFYLCSLCGSQTNLDQSTVYELEKILIQQQRKSDKNIQMSRQYSNNKLSMQKENTPLKLLKNTQKSENQQSIEQLYNQSIQKLPPCCPDHPDEFLNYFCFDCKSQCICSECVIHGVHKNHEVKTLKKSFPIVKSKLDECTDQIDAKIQIFVEKKDFLEGKRVEIQDNLRKIKGKIVDEMEELKIKIQQKQQELLFQCDQIFDNNSREIDQNILQVETKIGDLVQTSDFIFDNTQDEVLLLNFYAENMDRLYRIISKDESDHKYNVQLQFPTVEFSVIQSQIRQVFEQILLIDIKCEEGEIISHRKPKNETLSFQKQQTSTQNYDLSDRDRYHDAQKYQFLTQKLKEQYEKKLNSNREPIVQKLPEELESLKKNFRSKNLV